MDEQGLWDVIEWFESTEDGGFTLKKDREGWVAYFGEDGESVIPCATRREALVKVIAGLG
jgi:hypothetical protein